MAGILDQNVSLIAGAGSGIGRATSSHQASGIELLIASSSGGAMS